MKNLFKIALLTLALAVCGACDDDDNVQTRLTPNANNIAGTWQLAQFSGQTLGEGTYVYIEFIRKETKFEMYQNLDSFLPRLLTGRFGIREEEGTGYIIEGLYDYGTGFWNHEYLIGELTADRMVWTALDDPEDVQVYVRCDGIPEDIR
ncbi:MAG: lipocalin family protein [Alistipes sp.]|nr:lipocalin family protein [Alistipes sp.]MDE7344336.1 lipocalin family protein [Alistipes sp.]